MELVHSQFKVSTQAGAQIPMELIAVTPGRNTGRGPDGAHYESFSLSFRGPLDPFLLQGTYAFQHDRVGTVDLFTVPIGRGQKGTDYEVVINRVVDKIE